MSPITRRGFLAAATSAVAAPRSPPPHLACQRDELALFAHCGVNTSTDREWGDGQEDPAIFAPSALDTRQWARTARAAGVRGAGGRASASSCPGAARTA